MTDKKVVDIQVDERKESRIVMAKWSDRNHDGWRADLDYAEKANIVHLRVYMNDPEGRFLDLNSLAEIEFLADIFARTMQAIKGPNVPS